MTQLLKCDYLVRLKIFAPNSVRLFSRVLSIDTLFLSEIILSNQNWLYAKL